MITVVVEGAGQDTLEQDRPGTSTGHGGQSLKGHVPATLVISGPVCCWGPAGAQATGHSLECEDAVVWRSSLLHLELAETLRRRRWAALWGPAWQHKTNSEKFDNITAFLPSPNFCLQNQGKGCGLVCRDAAQEEVSRPLKAAPNFCLRIQGKRWWTIGNEK